MAEQLTNAPAPTPSEIDPRLAQLSQIKYRDDVKKALRNRGVNVTRLEGELQSSIDAALSSGDIQKARSAVFSWAQNTDSALGGKQMSSQIGSLFNSSDVIANQITPLYDKKPIQTPETEADGGAWKNFGKAVYNFGAIDLLGGIKKIGLTYGNTLTKAFGSELDGVISDLQANKKSIAIDESMELLKLKLDKGYEQAWVQPGDDKNSILDFKFGDFKSFVGTAGQLVGFIAPALLTRGAAGLSRTAILGRGVAASAPELAAQYATSANKIALGVNFGTEFSITYGQVVRDATDSGINFNDAIKVALPVALGTAAISQIGANNLISKFGMSAASARAASSQISREVMGEQLQRLAGRALNPSDFLDVARAITAQGSKRFTREAAMNALKSMVKSSFLEFSEEFSQSGLDLLAKATYNSLESAGADSAKFKDLTFKEGLKSAIAEGIVGGIFGATYGWAGNNSKLDATIYSSIKDSISKSKAAMGSNFDPNKVDFDVDRRLNDLVQSGSIAQSEIDGLKTKIGLMKKVAFDFSDSDATIQEQRFMFNVAKAKYNIAKKEEIINQALGYINDINQNDEISEERKLYEVSKAKKILGKEIIGVDGSTTYESVTKLEEEKSDFEQLFKRYTEVSIDKSNANSERDLRLAALDELNKKYGNKQLDFNPEVVVEYNGKTYLVDTQTHNEPLIREFSKELVEGSKIEKVLGNKVYTPSIYTVNDGQNVTSSTLAKAIINAADSGKGVAYSEDIDTILSAKEDLLSAKRIAAQDIENIKNSAETKEKKKKLTDNVKKEFAEKYDIILKYISQVDPDYKVVGSEDMLADLDLGSKKEAADTAFNSLNDMYSKRSDELSLEYKEKIDSLKSSDTPPTELEIGAILDEFNEEMESLNENYKSDIKALNKSNKSSFKPISLERNIQEAEDTSAQDEPLDDSYIEDIKVEVTDQSEDANKTTEKSTENYNKNETTGKTDATDELDEAADRKLQQSTEQLSESQNELDTAIREVSEAIIDEQTAGRLDEQVSRLVESIDNVLQQTGTDVIEESNDQNTNTTRVVEDTPTTETGTTNIALSLFDKKIQKNFPFLQKAFNFLSESEFKDKINELYPANNNSGVYAFIDPKTGNIYFDKDNISGKSLIHELGHVWALWAKESLPEAYQKGINLIKGSVYESKAKKLNPELVGEALYNEALSLAIGDKGSFFITKSKKDIFLSWVKEVFDKVGKYFGFTGTTDIGSMTLDDFTSAVVKDIFNKKINIKQSELAERALKVGFLKNQPITFTAGETGRTLLELEQKRDSMYAAFLAVPGADPRKVAQRDILNRGLIDETGFKLMSVKPDGTPVFRFVANDVNENDVVLNSFYNIRDEDGTHRYFRVRKEDVVNYLKNGPSSFLSVVKGKLKNIYEGKGLFGKRIIDPLERMIPKNIFALLDNGDGTMHRFFDDLIRKGQLDKFMYMRTIHPLQGKLAAVLGNYDTGYINSYEDAKKETITVFSRDGIGTEDIEVPIDVLLSMYRAHKSQLESHGRSSVISNAGRRNIGGDDSTKPYGYVYYEKTASSSVKEDQIRAVLMSQAEMDRIEAMILSDPILVEANDIMAQIYNNEEALSLIKTVNDTLNPDSKFNSIENYSPLIPFKPSNTKTRMMVGDGLIENSRMLNQRDEAADAYLILPPLLEVNNHTTKVGRILGSAVLAQNIQKFNDDLKYLYNNSDFKQLGDKMNTLYEWANGVYKDPKKSVATEGVNFLTSQFVKSVFRFNRMLPFKQLGTGLSIIDVRDDNGKRLISTAAAKSAASVLFKLGVIDNYTRNIAATTENQYAGTMKDYIDEMQSFGTLWPTINRIMEVDVNGVYGLSSIDKSLSSDISGKIINGYRSFDNFMDRWGMSFTKKADTAVIIMTFEAAKKQAIMNEFREGTDAYRNEVGRITNEVVFSTNQINDELEKTFFQTEEGMVDKAINMFSAQQQKIYNIVMNNYIKAAKDPNNAQKQAAVYKSIANSIFMNAIYIGAVTTIGSVLTKMLSGAEQDDEKELMAKFSTNVVSGILGTFPSIPTVAIDEAIHRFQSDFENGSTLGVPQGLVTIAKLFTTSSNTAKILADKKDIDSNYMYELVNLVDRLTGLPESWMQVLRKRAYPGGKSSGAKAVINAEDSIFDDSTTDVPDGLFDE